MCSIQRVGILGIRSFSPIDLETIKFQKPLTLISGHNGAGKTVSSGPLSALTIHDVNQMLNLTTHRCGSIADYIGMSKSGGHWGTSPYFRQGSKFRD